MEHCQLSDSQFSLFQDYIDGSLESHGFPNYIVIETTNSCNLDCVMCPRGTMKRKVGFMDFALFRKIIDEIEGKTEFIYLHFFGEPLLHDKLLDFIDYSAGKGMTVAFSTNGCFLNEEMADLLIASKLDMLIISIDSIAPETYGKIRVHGDYANTMKHIDAFLGKYQKAKPTLNVALQLIRMNLNEHEVDAFKAKWAIESGINVVVKSLHNYANQVEGLDALGYKEQVVEKDRRCVENWRSLVVGWDGIVVPCCNDYDYKYPLGDVNKNTLQDIWNSVNMKNMRRIQNEGRQSELALCNSCYVPHEDYLMGKSIYSRFNPARAEAQAYFNKGIYGIMTGTSFSYLCTAKRFELLIQDRFKDVVIKFNNQHADKHVIQMRVMLFNHDVGVFEIGKETVVLLKTPDEYKGRLLRYCFELSENYTPTEFTISGDMTELGVDVLSITNSPPK